MGLFDSAEELARKANLKKLEDRRVAFAQKLAQQGFAPEKMLFAQNDNGGFTALCRTGGKYWLIISPGFGSDDDFVLESYDALDWRVEEVLVKSEGMGGIFGFGKKGEMGSEFFIRRHDGSEARMPFVSGRGNWMEATLSKNPLVKTQRRRGDANLVWDMKPLDRTQVERVVEIAKQYFQ